MSLVIAPRVGAGLHPLTLKGSIAFGTATLAAGKCVGGLVTVQTPLPASAEVRLVDLAVVALLANVSTPQSLLAHVFDELPTGTFTDAATLALAAGDAAKLVYEGTVAIASAAGGAAWWAASINRSLILDATGKLYFSIASAATNLVFGGAGTLAYRIGLQY